MNLENTNIIVTGGSSGIGKATAKHLVKKRAKVVITGRHKNRLEKAAQEVGAIPFVFDISNIESIPTKTKEILEVLDNKVDALVNNAGIGGEFSTLGNITAEDFKNVYNTNVIGLTLFTQELLPALKVSKGTMINVGSTASQKGFGRGSVYASSKFAVRALTQSWQAELRKDNIRVALVNPSEVFTNFNNTSGEERQLIPNKLNPDHIAHTIVSVLEMDNVGFIPEVTVWATNPF